VVTVSSMVYVERLAVPPAARLGLGT